MTQNEIAELKTKIKAAFAARSYPGDDQLVYSLDDLECVRIAEAFRDQHWMEIAPQIIEDNTSALSFFTPAVWRFYLPAYMLVGLDILDGNAMNSVCFTLLPPVIWIEQRKAREAKMVPLEALGLSPEETERLRTVREQSIEMAERQRDRVAEEAAVARVQKLFEDNIDGLTSQEKSVVREFLEYLHKQWPDDEDTWLALERYWRQF